MKKYLVALLVIIPVITFCSCIYQSPGFSGNVTAMPGTHEVSSPVYSMPNVSSPVYSAPVYSGPVISPTVYPPTPPSLHTPTPFTPDVPDKAGTDSVLFDIYHRQALVDLNGDGILDQIVYNPGDGRIAINGIDYSVKWFEQIGDSFAITDINRTDGLLEIVITMPDIDSLYEDYEILYYMSSHVYWWNGTNLKDMGKVGNLSFDGHYRSGLNPEKFFDGAGLVKGVAFTNEFSPIYYTAHYLPDGADRKLKEDNYVTKILSSQPNYVLKPDNYCLLLNDITTHLYSYEHNADWDYASYLHSLPRTPNPYGDGTITVVAQPGEVLVPVRVYGMYWIKLKTSDNLQGWIKCKDGKILNYYQIMNLTADDMFEDLHMAP
jgi:hypothetical protein